MDLSRNEEHEEINKGFDLFLEPSINTTIEERHWMKIHPVSSLENEALLVYEFTIDNGHYVDISKVQHYVRFRIMKEDRRTPIMATSQNGAPAHKERIAPINYYGNTMFSKVELYLNNELVETANNLYPYKAFCKLSFLTLETLKIIR